MEPFPFPSSLRTVHCAPCRLRGQSLTELMMVLAVAGILATTAAPAMQNIVYEQRLITYANELLGDLQIARSEAIKRATQVTLCKSNDGAVCSTTSNWQDGWIVFVDTDGNESIDSGETIIRVRQSLGNAITVNFSAFGPNRYIAYFPSGESKKNGTFTFCDTRGAANARAIIVAYSGRVRAWDKSTDEALECS